MISSAWSERFWCLSWERRYSYWLHTAIRWFMCCLGERVQVKSRIMVTVTLSIPEIKGGRDHLGKHGQWKTISLVLRVLTLSLLILDYWRIWENSASNEVGKLCGTSKVVSSAYIIFGSSQSWGPLMGLTLMKRGFWVWRFAISTAEKWEV